MTSSFLGVSLGIIVSTLVMPIAWLYLRSNTTRRQPWQVEEVSVGSRVAIALGRFLADVAVLLGVLLGQAHTMGRHSANVALNWLPAASAIGGTPTK